MKQKTYVVVVDEGLTGFSSTNKNKMTANERSLGGRRLIDGLS